jgi:hypothetical protein
VRRDRALANRVLRRRRRQLAVDHRDQRAVAERPDVGGAFHLHLVGALRRLPRPFGSCSASMIGCGNAGTVATIVRVGMRSPVLSSAAEPVAPSSITLNLISTPRFARIFCAKSARLGDISGRMRSPACSRITLISAGSIDRNERASPRTKSFSSAIASTPENPPPATDERQQLLAEGRILLDRALAHGANQVVAQVQAVDEVLERERVLRQPAHAAEVGHVAERQDEMIERGSRAAASGSRDRR